MRNIKDTAKNSKNPEAAELLAIRMSNISEDYYCASWLSGLEYTLWNMLHDGDLDFGFGTVKVEEIEELRRLHELSGGWWMWVGDGANSGEEFVTTEEWVKHLNEGDYSEF